MEIYHGRVFKVEVDRVRLPHGTEAPLEVIRHPPSVVLVPMPDPDHVILIRQYRYAADDWLWELPAGSVDPGEDVETAARRECHEEVGLVPQRLERLGSFLPTPGYCDEEMIFFRATELTTPEQKAAQDEDESVEPRVFTLADARALVRTVQPGDMKTALGLWLI
jgi:ADP-ribose pyrophosphatase